MRETLRFLLGITLAFTIGAECAALHFTRADRDVNAIRLQYERQIGDLKVQKECAYHSGYDEGWRDATKVMEPGDH